MVNYGDSVSVDSNPPENDDYGECDYGGCVSVRVLAYGLGYGFRIWVMAWVGVMGVWYGLWYGSRYGLRYGLGYGYWVWVRVRT